MCANRRPNQNIMQKWGKNQILQIKLKFVGCDETGNDKFSVYTCYTTFFVAFAVIDKQ